MPIAAVQKVPIRWRLALWYLSFLLATVAIIGVFLLTTLETNLRHEIDAALSARASRIEYGITPRDIPLGPDDVTASILRVAPLEEFSAPGIYAQILDLEGDLLSSSPNLMGGRLPVAPTMMEEGLSGREAYGDVPAGRERIRVLVRPVQAGEQVVGLIVVGESLYMLHMTLRRMQQLLTVAAITSALVSIAGGWWLTTRAMGPIAEVTRVARRITATGRFQQRIVVPPARDELGELAATFNEMLAGLEKTFQRQREFLADASHELRGPLMVIRGNLDLLKMELPLRERLESAREATEEVERMTRLVTDLLFLAEVDAQEIMQQQPVPLHEVLTAVLDRAKNLDAGAHSIALAHNEPVIVRGDRDRLVQMLSNLIENARRYTPAGGSVTVSLRDYGQVAELMVTDTGTGIPPEHLPHIFERFYRVDRARSRIHGSTGLGLAIVKQVAEAHGGQVRVRSELGAGSTFTVALPTMRSR